MLNRLGDYFDFIHRARSRIINGLVYPAFLLHAAIIIPAVPLLFTKGFGAFLAATLPALAILYGLAAAVVFLARKSGPASAFSARFNRVVLAIPVVGSLARKLALLRFLQAFVCLYTAGIEVREAVELAARTMGNAAMEEEMLHSVVLLRNSATISEAFAENPFLPPVLRDMIRVGAVSGKMDETLTSVIGYLQEDVDNTTAKLVSLLPVIVYLLVAVYIGYVIISFYLGYLNQVMTEL
ncbi:MAG: Type II secretion system protein F [candidate division TA06 bacterium ADurb.Bin417]|uniref:Type II secretion system protein F n=1 Tax=candidate division TA06 bacterium ADurb.Bin417 TaxID=1852828 RepID=A0A1V5M603_UNCT6|nr:MAG: Type II secretion system protein F [candidate division TA06 bacterium ADurb.Bin417]